MNVPQHYKIVCSRCCENQFNWYRFKAKPCHFEPPTPIPPITGKIIPTVNRYFYIVVSDINLVNGVTINANNFYDDNGNFVPKLKIFNPNGYTNLYINAVMQEGGIYSINSNALVIKPAPTTIRRGTPIIIESIGFEIA